MNYNLKYDFDADYNCGVIFFNDEKVLIDFKDLFSIINFDKNFIYYNKKEKNYPYYLRHNQKISYLDFIYKYDPFNIIYCFKNNNQYDLRRDNISVQHKYHDKMCVDYNIINYTLGHYTEIGKDAYLMKNPMWKIKENNKEYILMYCEKETIVKLCPLSYQKILDFEKEYNEDKKITFFKNSCGYIMSSNNLYIHQIITGCYGNGKGTNNISVDHIDQDPLNNSWENLRIATREEQEQNSKGIKEGTIRARKKSAKPLPEGITKEMFRKYVVYYHEWLNPEKTRSREFFKIEKHPKSNKNITGTKSNSVSILDKLSQINKIADELG
jgi:hypothetical protein